MPHRPKPSQHPPSASGQGDQQRRRGAQRQEEQKHLERRWKFDWYCLCLKDLVNALLQEQPRLGSDITITGVWRVVVSGRSWFRPLLPPNRLVFDAS